MFDNPGIDIPHKLEKNNNFNYLYTEKQKYVGNTMPRRKTISMDRPKKSSEGLSHLGLPRIVELACVISELFFLKQKGEGRGQEKKNYACREQDTKQPKSSDVM